MNKTQLINLVAKAGVKNAEISGAGKSLEIEVSERDSKKLARAGLTWGGYKTGHGAWVLRANYVSQGDWNSKGSEWHR